MGRILIEVHDVHPAVVAGVIVTGIIPARLPVAAVNLVTIPVEIKVEPRAHGETNAKCDQRAVILGVGLHIDNVRIVLRNVEIFGLGRNNADERLFLNDDLLRGVHQVSRRLSLGAKLLDGIHHIGWLNEKCLAQTGRPFEVLVHPGDDFRVAG